MGIPRRAIPPTAFGQPNGNKPSNHRFSKDNPPPKVSRGGLTTQSLIKANGELATRVRNHLLRASLRVLEDIETIAEGGDPHLAAKEALQFFNSDVRATLRDAEAAAGLSSPSPEDTPALAGPTDVRTTAMAALELLRRAARADTGDVIDAEVIEDGPE